MRSKITYLFFLFFFFLFFWLSCCFPVTHLFQTKECKYQKTSLPAGLVYKLSGVQSSRQQYTTRAQWVCPEAENSAIMIIVAIVKRLGFISRRGAEQVFVSNQIKHEIEKRSLSSAAWSRKQDSSKQK